VDVDFVRKAVRAIGQTAIKIDTAAERCVGVLMELIETRVSYVVQEAVIVIKVSVLRLDGARKLKGQDIFRKYPHNYEGIIPILCSNLEELDEPEAKASLIWIVGEYAEKIENADELLGTFLDAFKEESYPVSLLHRSSKINLIKPGTIANSYGDCQVILEEARGESGDCAEGLASCYERLRQP
jgi:AP-1 complex subunit beta-1